MIPLTFDPTLALALVEAGPDALLVCDAEGRIVLANARAEQLFGYAPGELPGMPVEVLIPERMREGHVALRRMFTTRGEARPMGQHRPFVARRHDGSEFPAEISLSPIRTERGAFVAAAVRDVSALRQMERALADAERHLREIFEHAPDAIFVADLSGRYTDVNPAACAMLGYAREELVGKTIVDLIDAEDFARLATARERLLEPGIVDVEEWTLRRKDGKRVLVEVSAKILEGGRWQAMVREIGGRKQLEQEREEALRGLRAVLDQCPVGIVLLTLQDDGPHASINVRGQELLGQRADRVRVDDYVRFFQWPDGSPLRPDDAPSYRALHGERTEPTELVIVRPDGQRLPILVRGAPVVAPDGRVVGGLVAFEDISAEKHLERLRAEWNAIVAHDLRNPLNVITLHAQLASRAARDNPVVAESMPEIQTAVARLNRMVQDLLDLSRLEVHNLPLRREEMRLSGVVRKAVDRAALTAADRNFELRDDGEAPAVAADVDRIAQVLDNLLTNAIKYGEPGTPIVVEVRLDGNDAVVAVTNQGAAIPPESLRQLFQRFHRAADGRLASVKGVGLGLYIARELIEAHGGRLAAESTPDGTTTFHFTLPGRGA